MADKPKSTPVLLALFAALVAYAGYSGDGVNLIGLEGIKFRMERVDSMQDTLALLQSQIDTAKRDLATGSVEDVRKRVEAYRASLNVLRTLVPDQNEVADLLDDILIRAKVRGLNTSGFVPQAPRPGPEPFDTYLYQMSVIGRYHQVGAFLTDIASLRRIIVPGDVVLAAANMQQARALGDTTAMLEARFTVRTYTKAQLVEDSTNVP